MTRGAADMHEGAWCAARGGAAHCCCACAPFAWAHTCRAARSRRGRCTWSVVQAEKDHPRPPNEKEPYCCDWCAAALVLLSGGRLVERPLLTCCARPSTRQHALRVLPAAVGKLLGRAVQSARGGAGDAEAGGGAREGELTRWASHTATNYFFFFATVFLISGSRTAASYDDDKEQGADARNGAASRLLSSLLLRIAAVEGHPSLISSA